MSQPNIKVEYEQSRELNKESVENVQIMYNPHYFEMVLSQDIHLVENHIIIGILKKVIGRYAMTPKFAKDMLITLQRNVTSYEERYGEIVLDVPVGMQ